MTTTTSTPCWAIYVRVSTPHKADGFTLDHRKEQTVAYAERQEWPWRLFEDIGISGGAVDEPPGLAAMLDEIDHA